MEQRLAMLLSTNFPDSEGDFKDKKDKTTIILVVPCWLRQFFAARSTADVYSASHPAPRQTGSDLTEPQPNAPSRPEVSAPEDYR